MVGSVIPSTRFLGEVMLNNIDFDKVRLIVELGSGTGVFTNIIMERMHSDARLLAFELNDNFYESLNKRINDPRVKVLHKSAEFVNKYLNENEKVDVVVSSLPLMSFSEKLRTDVVQAAYSFLKKKGKYIQFQYSLQSKKMLEAYYQKVSVEFTVKNFPPAFIYTCKKI